MNTPIHKVVILGGGSAGWMTAAMLARTLGQNLEIEVIESSSIGTVGVGEATIPPIKTFNDVLGLDEAEFLRKTKGTIKLGIEFENWGQEGDCYMHAFGPIGRDLGLNIFHHHWRRARQLGIAGDFWDYSLNYQAAKQNKFMPMARIPDTRYEGLVHAYHFDAGLYAQMLQAYSQEKGVSHTDARVETVLCHPDTGAIESLQLENGESISGDLFIDCSGFRALLIGETLGVGYEDWSHWLPCDRALAVPSEAKRPIIPYTRSIAHEGGWQWRIPLQHRTGNGLVYSQQHLSDDEASHLLLSNLDGAPLAEPRPIRFTTGRRRQQWHKNVVSLGLASGFLEPLESTSLHMVQSGVFRLVKLFPHACIYQSDIDEYNRQSQIELEKIRDFIILHYHLNQKPESPFWRQCREVRKPESLLRRIDLFANAGRVFREQEELFTEVAWQQVMLGQGLLPEDYHPQANNLTEDQLNRFITGWGQLMQQTVQKLPDHEQFLQKVIR